MRKPAWWVTAVAAVTVATGFLVVQPLRAGEYSPSEHTKVVILGSGTPLPEPHRRGPAVAVIVNGRPYIVDAGEGIWRATGAATPRFGGEIEALAAPNLNQFPLTLAYRFTTPDRVITISGDTVPCEGIETASRNADVLMHEVYGINGLANAPWGGDDVQSKKKAMSLYHTSTEELAQLANKVRPGLLVLYHEQNYTDDPKANVKEIRRFGYCGPVVSSNDQDIF